MPKKSLPSLRPLLNEHEVSLAKAPAQVLGRGLER